MKLGKVSKIGLWGRSMGAVTAIMYSAKNPGISCVVLDSPYATFKRLVHELVKNRSKVPSFLTSLGLKMVRRTVKKKAKFDINSLVPMDYMKQLNIPALFGAPKDDTFVSPQHTKDLYLAHNGIKQLAIFEGDHNSQRSFEWIVTAMDFFKKHLIGNNVDNLTMTPTSTLTPYEMSPSVDRSPIKGDVTIKQPLIVDRI